MREDSLSVTMVFQADEVTEKVSVELHDVGRTRYAIQKLRELAGELEDSITEYAARQGGVYAPEA